MTQATMYESFVADPGRIQWDFTGFSPGCSQGPGVVGNPLSNTPGLCDCAAWDYGFLANDTDNTAACTSGNAVAGGGGNACIIICNHSAAWKTLGAS